MKSTNNTTKEFSSIETVNVKRATPILLGIGLLSAAFAFLTSCNSGIDTTVIPVKNGETWSYVNLKGEKAFNIDDEEVAEANYFIDGIAKTFVWGPENGSYCFIGKNGRSDFGDNQSYYYRMSNFSEG